MAHTRFNQNFSWVFDQTLNNQCLNYRWACEETIQSWCTIPKWTLHFSLLTWVKSPVLIMTDLPVSGSTWNSTTYPHHIRCLGIKNGKNCQTSQRKFINIWFCIAHIIWFCANLVNRSGWYIPYFGHRLLIEMDFSSEIIHI